MARKQVITGWNMVEESRTTKTSIDIKKVIKLLYRAKYAKELDKLLK